MTSTSEPDSTEEEIGTEGRAGDGRYRTRTKDGYGRPQGDMGRGMLDHRFCWPSGTRRYGKAARNEAMQTARGICKHGRIKF